MIRDEKGLGDLWVRSLLDQSAQKVDKQMPLHQIT